MDAIGFESSVRQGVVTGNWQSLEAWINEESSFSYNFEDSASGQRFDSRVFSRIVSWLGELAFLQADGSSTMLRIIEYDWGALTDNQRNRLLPAIETAFPKIRDPLSIFLIAEILGEYYHNLGAFNTLRSLSRIPSAPHRALVAMGLGVLARMTSETAIKQCACAELQILANDPVPHVCDEAKNALLRISNS